MNNNLPQAPLPQGSIVGAMILEKVTNTEEEIHANKLRRKLKDIIKLNGRREKKLRECTITLKVAPANYDIKSVALIIEEEYNKPKGKNSCIYWQDKDHVYVQFDSSKTKMEFLQFSMNNLSGEFNNALMCINQSTGLHFERKPVKIDIMNVKKVIKTEIIENQLKILVSHNGQENQETQENQENLHQGAANHSSQQQTATNHSSSNNNNNKTTTPNLALAKIENFRQGKPHATSGARCLMFKCNAEAFKILFDSLNGHLPYVDNLKDIRHRLFLKVNVKPWLCKECYRFGQHKCEGMSCATCGVKGHLTKVCKSPTKFCVNCQKRGHRAKDIFCPKYLTEVGKEIRKLDIPLEFYEDEKLSFALIKHLTLK